VLPDVEVARSRVTDTRADFLMLIASGVSTVRSSSGFDLETGHLGIGSPPVNVITPEFFQFFERITNPNSICKGYNIRTIGKNWRKDL
jgi:hypothetical protein